VTTIEEYQHQRYEGGSTAYGPHTHGAMTNILREMAEDAADAQGGQLWGTYGENDGKHLARWRESWENMWRSCENCAKLQEITWSHGKNMRKTMMKMGKSRKNMIDI